MQPTNLRKFLTVSLLFWLALSFAATAQLPEDLKITNFDGTSGFYSRVVRAFLKDRKGFVWIGSSDGLYRYDGYSFRNYRKQVNDSNSLSENYVFRLALGKDDKIWMGLAKGGVSSFDPATGVFRNYPVKMNGKPVTGAVNMILVDHNNQVWLGIAQKGLWHLDTKTGEYTSYDVVTDKNTEVPKERRREYNTISDAIETNPGRIWLATHNGLYQFDTYTKQMIAVGDRPKQLNVFRDDDFISITANKDLLWLGSWAGGLTRYNTLTHEWKNFKSNGQETKKYTTNIISGVRVKSENELWISSNDKGLGVFDIKKEQFRFYSEDALHQNDIPQKLCFGVETDMHGNVWLLHEWGLTRIQPRENKFVFTKVPVSKTDNAEYYYLRDLVEDDRHIYIAITLADGLHVVDKKTGVSEHFPVKVMPNEEPFQSVCKLLKDSKGKIWVISRDYIYQYDTQKENLVLIEQPAGNPLQNGTNAYNNIAEDKKGHIWITSSRHGIFEYVPENHTYRHYYHDPADKHSLSSDLLSAVAVDKKGRVWVGSPYGCLAYFDHTTGKFQNYSFFTKNNTEVANVVRTIFADSKGNIWAGADAGLMQIDANKESPEVKKIYTAQDGLRGDQAYSICEDVNGNIWCTTTSALCMVNSQTQRVNSIVLQNDVMKSIAAEVYLSATGNVLHALTYGGYYTFDPVHFNEKQTDPKVTITSFRVKDKEYYFEEALKKNGRIQLGANENLFSFEFAVLDFRQSDDRRYAYMLENFDKNWIYTDNRRYAGYTNIPGGNYIFKVKVLNSNGDGSNTIVSIPIHVSSPFYKTWWFLLFCAIDLSVILYVFYRFRLRKQREILQLQSKAYVLEKEKTQVQYENLKQHLNPHFLFNSLTSLGSLIRLDQKLAADFLDGMSKIYRYILKSKDNELVSLKDEIKFIETFTALQKTRFREGLLIHLNIGEEHDHQKIVPVTLQNLVENAIKHNIVDEDTPLMIDLFVENGYLVVRNNMQKKSFVDTSNKQGLDNLFSLYKYLSDRPMLIDENEQFFTVKIPLL
jgi:ligand-binding sensor domain-containing protein